MVSEHTSVSAVPAGKLPGIVGGLWAGLEARIPFGYQDETGFHYGIEFGIGLLAAFLEPSEEGQPDPLPS